MKKPKNIPNDPNGLNDPNDPNGLNVPNGPNVLNGLNGPNGVNDPNTFVMTVKKAATYIVDENGNEIESETITQISKNDSTDEKSL